MHSDKMNIRGNTFPFLTTYIHETIHDKTNKIAPSELLILPVYESLFNLMSCTEQWLIGKIKPIFKNKGDSTDPNTYRPISILSCLGKLFTAVLNDRLCNFLEYNEMIHENQAGFRKHYSTTDQFFLPFTYFLLPCLLLRNNANVQYLNLKTTVQRKLINIQFMQWLTRS